MCVIIRKGYLMIKFDSGKDPKTHKIQINELKYQCINGTTYTGDYKRKKISKNKYVIVWVGEEVWVTEEAANEAVNCGCAKIVATRSTANAINNVDKSEAEVLASKRHRGPNKRKPGRPKIKKRYDRPGRPKGSTNKKKKSKVVNKDQNEFINTDSEKIEG